MALEDEPLYLLRQFAGGTIHTSALALDVARALLRHHYDPQESSLSEPLEVADDGDAWKITGKHFYSEQKQGRCQAHVRINKADGRALKLEMHFGFEIPDEVKEIIAA